MGIGSSVFFFSAKRALQKHKGVMTWDFSQMNYSVWKVISQDDTSKQGICKALSAQWIVDHAYGGSLANRIMDRDGKMSQSAVRMIMQNFILAFDSQDKETEVFLTKRGILERKGSRSISVTSSRRVDGKKVDTTRMAASTVSTAAVGGANGNVGLELSQALRDVSNCYAQISFGRAEGIGHAVAAWIGGPSYGSAGDALFYDPNLGEVWFERKADFFEWFKYFYETSYQGFPLKFNGRWNITQWALANGAEKGAYAKAVLSVAGAR